MAFRYEECASCAHHFYNPAVCDTCEDADEFEPDEGQDRRKAAGGWGAPKMVTRVVATSQARVTVVSQCSLPLPIMIKAEPK